MRLYCLVSDLENRWISLLPFGHLKGVRSRHPSDKTNGRYYAKKTHN